LSVPETPKTAICSRPSRIHPKTGASGWSLNKANETIARLQKDREKYRALRRAAGMIRSMLRENLRQQLRSGLISQDTYDLLTNQWQNYIPLKGMDGMDEQGGWMPRGKGFDVRGDEFKQAKGRSTDAQDVVAHAISQTTMSITRQENNKGNKALLKLIANVDPKGEKIAQVYWLGDKDGAEFDGLDGLTKAKDVYRRTIVNGKVVMRKASNPFTVNNIGDVVAGKIGGENLLYQVCGSQSRACYPQGEQCFHQRRCASFASVLNSAVDHQHPV
jgi:hypothetical protein